MEIECFAGLYFENNSKKPRGIIRMMMDESTKITIVSSVLKKQCKENGITQKQICAQTGMSKQYVSAFFSGDTTINAVFIK